MSYRVVKFFYDLQDDAHPYQVGQEFPRQGKTASDARIAELAGNKNRQHVPLIERVPDLEPPAEPEKPKRAKKKKVEAE